MTTQTAILVALTILGGIVIIGIGPYGRYRDSKRMEKAMKEKNALIEQFAREQEAANAKNNGDKNE